MTYEINHISCDVCGIEETHTKAMSEWDINWDRKTVVKCPMCSAKDSGLMEAV